MTLQEKLELVRLLNLYQADLLNLNRKNIENGKTEYFVHGVKAQYEHARIISTKLSVELGKEVKSSHGGRYNNVHLAYKSDYRTSACKSQPRYRCHLRTG